MEVEILKRKSGIKKLCKNEASNNNSYNKNGDTIIGFGNLAWILLQSDFESRSLYYANKVKTQDAFIWRNFEKLVKFCYNEVKFFDFPLSWWVKCPSALPHEFA